MYIKAFPAIFLLLFTCAIEAAALSINGVVVDLESNQVLPYASIAVSGKSIGTISNSEGRFVLSAEHIQSNDSILISYMGYETLKLPFEKALSQTSFYLKPANINLSEVKVYSRNLSVEEIIERVVENYSKNHPQINQRQRLFVHSFIQTPFSKQNTARIVKSNFKGMSKEKFDAIFNKIPAVFTDYNDAIFDLYSYDSKYKLNPIQGISLEEGDQDVLLKEIEQQMTEIIADFENAIKNPDVYYKFKTGIFGFKFNPSEDENNDNDYSADDSLNFKIPTASIKYETGKLISEFSTLEGENTEFLKKKGKYRFKLENIEFYNGELVYRIKFEPKRTGLFEGEIFISTSDFGIHQMDYTYAKGKSTENIKILGFGHAINKRKGRVIFDKGPVHYHLKFIMAEESEMAAIDRKFSFLKKEKRFLIDKELSQIKFDVDLFFNIQSKWELLVLEHETLNEEDFDKLEQAKFMNFKKELAHSPKDWENRTYIVPGEELIKYTRKTTKEN